MDKNNRLSPQSKITNNSPSTRQNVVSQLHPARPQQKLMLRRRCRSECLQKAPPVVGAAADELIDFRQKLPSQQQQQPIFRNMLHKLSPAAILRNQDSANNIFTIVDQSRRNGCPASLKHSTKENILSQTPTLCEGDDINGDCKEMNNLNKYQRNDKDLELVNIKSMTYNNHQTVKSATDRNKRRARSESEPHEIYYTKSSPNKNDKNKGYDLVLKRSREDKSYYNNKNGQQLDGSAKTKLINNKLANGSLIRPCTPRYPIKPINGSRKLKSRNSFAKFNKNKNNMVVSNPPALRCPTPVAPPAIASLTINGDEEDDDDGNSRVGEGGDEGNEDSDGYCSTLDDDDDFEGTAEDECNDSLSDLEDSINKQTNGTNEHRKLTDPSMTTECVVGKYVKTAPLAASLFPHVPPYITFASHTEKGPPMPPAVAKVLKWKLTTITPIVIRKVLSNSGFRLLRNDELAEEGSSSGDDGETNDWMGVWGKHMKSPLFKTVRSYQKINHIPGSFQIGRKDRVWRNLQTLMARHGKKEFGFMPRTYVIPSDIKQLRKIWPKYSQRNVKWIIKPPASARGTGIKVVNRWSQIPKRKPLIVQKYVDRPLLINGSKFDLRLYVLVTSINPLRVYMHTDGLARFASVKYSEKSDTLHDRYMHLTNYSINKFSTNYSNNEDATACKGHKWTVKSLWNHLAEQGVNTKLLWAALRNLVLRTILAGENAINQLTKINMGSKYNCFELFGIDVILDSELIPWLLEVNISPSLHSASPLDLHVKGPLVQALLNTSLYQVPPRIPLAQQHEIMTEQGLAGNLCHDKRIFVTNLSKAERSKHNQFTHRTVATREDYLDEILKDLTPDDVRCLLITEDELARSGPLERICPSETTHKYLHFMESPRYYNRLLDAWEHRYGGEKRDDGIELLRTFCQDKYHLSVPPPQLKKDCESSPTTATTIIIPQTTPKENGDINAKSDETIILMENGEKIVDLIKKTLVDVISPPASPESDAMPQTPSKILANGHATIIRSTPNKLVFNGHTEQLLFNGIPSIKEE